MILLTLKFILQFPEKVLNNYVPPKIDNVGCEILDKDRTQTPSKSNASDQSSSPKRSNDKPKTITVHAVVHSPPCENAENIDNDTPKAQNETAIRKPKVPENIKYDEIVSIPPDLKLPNVLTSDNLPEILKKFEDDNVELEILGNEDDGKNHTQTSSKSNASVCSNEKPKAIAVSKIDSNSVPDTKNARSTSSARPKKQQRAGNKAKQSKAIVVVKPSRSSSRMNKVQKSMAEFDTSDEEEKEEEKDVFRMPFPKKLRTNAKGQKMPAKKEKETTVKKEATSDYNVQGKRKRARPLYNPNAMEIDSDEVVSDKALNVGNRFKTFAPEDEELTTTSYCSDDCDTPNKQIVRILKNANKINSKTETGFRTSKGTNTTTNQSTGDPFDQLKSSDSYNKGQFNVNANFSYRKYNTKKTYTSKRFSQNENVADSSGYHTNESNATNTEVIFIN